MQNSDQLIYWELIKKPVICAILFPSTLFRSIPLQLIQRR